MIILVLSAVLNIVAPQILLSIRRERPRSGFIVPLGASFLIVVSAFFTTTMSNTLAAFLNYSLPLLIYGLINEVVVRTNVTKPHLVVFIVGIMGSVFWLFWAFSVAQYVEKITAFK